MSFVFKDKIKTLLAISTVVAGVFLLSGCQTEEKADTDTVASEKTIVIGIDNIEPYSYHDANGDIVGIDVEIARQAFGRLGYEPVFQFIDWEDKDVYLEDATIDCIWSCFTMTGREEKYQWAGPYMNSRQVVMVRKDSDIYELSDLADKSTAAQATTIGEKIFTYPADYGLPEVEQVTVVSTADDLYAILRKGYVNAIAGHEGILGKLLKDSDAYRLLEESPFMSELGVAFEKGTHQELSEELTEVLETMKTDGSIGQIAEKYGLDAEKTVWGGEEDEK